MPTGSSRPPDNVRSASNISGSNRRLTIAGILMWLVGGGAVVALLFTDFGGDDVGSVFRITIGLAGIAVVALVAGAIIYQILKRLNLVGSLLTNVFWGVLLSLALPVIGWFVVQELGLITGSIRAEMIDALPINEETMEGVAQARKALTGGE